MILVDTSVWIDHLREGSPQLEAALDKGSVLMHSLVLGELACGNLKARASTLRLLANLPLASRASDEEALRFMEAHRLMGKGIGIIDVHLLASTALEADTRLWTHDKSLRKQAVRLHLEYRDLHN